jgi:trk system potassium uptake protein TrkA
LERKTATRLFEKGAEVIAIDSQIRSLVDKIKDRVTHAIAVDVTEEKSIRSTNISDVDVAIVAIGDNIEMSPFWQWRCLENWVLVKSLLGPQINCTNMFLQEIGASEIIKVEEEMGEITASKIVAPHVLQSVITLLQVTRSLKLKLGKKFAGKTLG